MRMLIDAEYSYMQPAIDALTIALQQKFNKQEAVIMNTYQCYLKVRISLLYVRYFWRARLSLSKQPRSEIPILLSRIGLLKERLAHANWSSVPRECSLSGSYL